MTHITTITPSLWFDDKAEDAARLYTSLFPDSRVTAISHYTEVGRELHGREPGSVMSVAFELAGKPFTALNGGPGFPFSQAVSFQVGCQNQEEIDRYWHALTADGEPGPCGWLKDRFDLSWQIIPQNLPQLLEKPAAMQAMMQMQKIDLTALQQAANRD